VPPVYGQQPLDLQVCSCKITPALKFDVFAQPTREELLQYDKGQTYSFVRLAVLQAVKLLNPQQQLPRQLDADESRQESAPQ
jgi:hypothetical protein